MRLLKGCLHLLIIINPFDPGGGGGGGGIHVGHAPLGLGCFCHVGHLVPTVH